MAVKMKRTKKTLEINPPPQKKVNNKHKSSYEPSRFRWILAIIGLGVLLLCYKVFSIQLFDSERLIKEANDRSLRVKEVPFTRGRILDRNERLLSISVPMYSITLDPKEYFDSKIRRTRKSWKTLAMETGSSFSKIQASVTNFLNNKDKSRKGYKLDVRTILSPDSDNYWRDLSIVTGIEQQELIQKVKTNPSSEFVRLDREKAMLEQEKMEALARAIGQKYPDLMKNLYKNARQRFLYLSRQETESIANYAQALRIDAMVLKGEPRRVYPMAEAASQLVGFTDLDGQGQEGLERSFNSLLIGRNGRTIFRKDARGNVIENIRDEQQYDPHDVVLSIDEELQLMVYQEIKKAVIENKAESGTAVLVDVQTGEILAMANAPSFNPNNRANFKIEAMRNRAITDTFEPGSTVKPLTVLTALQQKATYLGEVINTRPFIVNGHTIKDVAPRESLTLTGILQKSSNIGVSRLALRMPATALVDTYNKVGFGKDTGLGLGEQRGTDGNRKRWSDIERATLAYGYGLNVTPLQLARAYATLGSFGIYRPLSITKVDPPVIGERVFSEKLTRDVVTMMESVAQKGEGGARAAVDGYRVAIKTGTARKLEKGKYVERYIAYTAGVAPASNPQFALVVLINDPKAGAYYGGAISAPLFSKIMGFTLRARNIKPDGIVDTKSAKRESVSSHKLN